MKKLLFILLLASCSKIETPKGKFDYNQKVYVSTTLDIAYKAYEIAYTNPNWTNAPCHIRVTGINDKLILPNVVTHSNGEYDATFIEGQDFVVRTKDKIYPIYDTIAYIPNMRMFQSKAKYFLEQKDFINLYKVYQNELVAIPISGKDYREQKKKGLI